MTRLFSRVFVDHPRTVDETYFQHMKFAGWFATRLFLAAGAATVHAVIPCVFEKTAGRMIGEMNARLTSRHNRGGVVRLNVCGETSSALPLRSLSALT